MNPDSSVSSGDEEQQQTDNYLELGQQFLARQKENGLPSKFKAIRMAFLAGVVSGVGHQLQTWLLDAVEPDRTPLPLLVVEYLMNKKIAEMLISPFSSPYLDAGPWVAGYLLGGGAPALLVHGMNALSFDNQEGRDRLSSLAIALVASAWTVKGSMRSLKDSEEEQARIFSQTELYVRNYLSIADAGIPTESRPILHALFDSGRKEYRNQLIEKIVNVMAQARGKEMNPPFDMTFFDREGMDKTAAENIIAAAEQNDREQLDKLLSPVISDANRTIAKKGGSQAPINNVDFLTLSQFLAKYAPLRDHLITTFPEKFLTVEQRRHDLAIRSSSMELEKRTGTRPDIEDIKSSVGTTKAAKQKAHRRMSSVDKKIFSSLDLGALATLNDKEIELAVFGLLERRNAIEKKMTTLLEKEIKQYLSVRATIDILASQEGIDCQWEPVGFRPVNTPLEVIKVEGEQVLLSIGKANIGKTKEPRSIPVVALDRRFVKMADNVALEQGKMIYINQHDRDGVIELLSNPISPKAEAQQASAALQAALNEANRLKELKISDEYRKLDSTEAIGFTGSYAFLLEDYRLCINRLCAALETIDEIVGKNRTLEKNYKDQKKEASDLLTSLQKNAATLEKEYKEHSEKLRTKMLESWINNLSYLKRVMKDGEGTNSGFYNVGRILFVPVYDNLAKFIFPKDSKAPSLWNPFAMDSLRNSDPLRGQGTGVDAADVGDASDRGYPHWIG